MECVSTGQSTWVHVVTVLRYDIYDVPGGAKVMQFEFYIIFTGWRIYKLRKSSKYKLMFIKTNILG